MPNWGFVWMVAWPDFRARLPRFLVIGIGMALVMAVTLLLAAFSEGFRLRSDRVLDVFGADRYVVAAGSSGPMTATTPIPVSLVREISERDGLATRSIFLAPNAILTDGSPQGVVVVGTEGDEPGLRIVSGRPIAGPDEALADDAIVGLAVDDQFVLAGETFTVVGQTEHVTWDIANAGLFIERGQALDLLAGGQDVVTAIAVDGDGEITRLPPTVEVQTRSQAFDDVLHRTAAAKRSIDSFTTTLWLLAVVIVGAVLYLAAIDRVRDFAIFKATGAENVDLVLGLALQAAFVGAIAGVLSIGLAHLLKPIYPGLLSWRYVERSESIRVRRSDEHTGGASVPDLIVDDLMVEYNAGDYNVRPLDGFGMRVADGSLAVLLGPSGCGKTTLLSCLGGILTPTSGAIRWGDTEVSALRGAALDEYRQRGVGIVFQSFNLIPSLTARDNVTAPLRAAGWKRDAARRRAAELLEHVGLGDRVTHRPSQLSGGQQQRVSLARALAHDPALIIADEPTASLDYVQVEGVLRLLRELAAPGRVVIVATHDNRLLPLADQIVEMVPRFHDDATQPVRAELAAGEVLFTQGSRGNRIYVIESGCVEILREHPNGVADVLATLGVGEHFGEMGPLFGLPRSATARAGATTPAIVIGYTTDQFRAYVGADRLTDLIRAEVSSSRTD
jgi:putative ABC transport system ATP-binding protein